MRLRFIYAVKVLNCNSKFCSQWLCWIIVIRQNPMYITVSIPPATDRTGMPFINTVNFNGLTLTPLWICNHMPRWSLGTNKYFHPTLHNRWNYLTMLGSKSIHISKTQLPFAEDYLCRIFFCGRGRHPITTHSVYAMILHIFVVIVYVPKDSCDWFIQILYPILLHGHWKLSYDPKENIKAPRHWPLWGEFTGDRSIPHKKGPVTRKMFSFDDVIMEIQAMMTSCMECTAPVWQPGPSQPAAQLHV